MVSHTICAVTKPVGEPNALSSVPGPVRYFLSAQLVATFGDRESIWSSKGRDESEFLKSSFHLAFSELTRRR